MKAKVVGSPFRILKCEYFLVLSTAQDRDARNLFFKPWRLPRLANWLWWGGAGVLERPVG